MTRPHFPRRGPPHTFGWQRRPNDDETGLPVWESPVGVDYVLQPDRQLVQRSRGVPAVPDKLRVPRRADPPDPDAAPARR